MQTREQPPAVTSGWRGQGAKALQHCAAAPELTHGQASAMETLLPFFTGHRPGGRAALLGYAGTGKTFLVGQLLQAALEHYEVQPQAGRRGWSRQSDVLVVAAPTHKAAAQLTQTLAAAGIDGIVPITLHSALGLRPERAEETERFVADRSAPRRIGEETHLVLVDEASMVSGELTELLLDALPAGATLVAVGDPAQLAPVLQSSDSPLLRAPVVALLEEVVRHQGPILAAATATRELGRGRPPWKAAADDHSAVILHEGYRQWRDAALSACVQAIQAGRPDQARLLAWTNNLVGKFNADLRTRLYGPSAPPFVEGELVVSASAIHGPEGTPVVASTTEMVVLSAAQEEGQLDGDELPEVREVLLGKRASKRGDPTPPWCFWSVAARVVSSGRRVEFPVLEPDQRTAWRKANNAIAKAARAARDEHGKEAAALLWNLYWDRRTLFGAIAPVSGLTVHKAQGSTFETVFLASDLDRNPSPGELNRLAYVGITRASRELHVLADPPGHPRPEPEQPFRTTWGSIAVVPVLLGQEVQ
ncbi:ATP-dependent RecD-like DNA helicase [Cyanobium sp. LEGE 06143]|uniref:ATP-dependent DNA helicase n=1 Tax=Cyanobium sp. LEGE 06143 TaxID=945727 RepID=UPI001D15A063|nr:AAA family ATPase [Cyanobium sp. LEGE 06143]